MKLAVEVSRCTWQRQSQIIAEAKKWPQWRVELNPELWVDDKARRGRRRAKGERSGDFRAIKLPGERLDGPGSTGDDHIRATISALRAAVKRKKARLSAYVTWSPDVWLFLIDDGYPGAWSEIFRRGHLWREVKSVCAQTGFERIYLYQFFECSALRID